MIVVDEDDVQRSLDILSAQGENAWLIGSIEAKEGNDEQVEINE